MLSIFAGLLFYRLLDCYFLGYRLGYLHSSRMLIRALRFFHAAAFRPCYHDLLTQSRRLVQYSLTRWLSITASLALRFVFPSICRVWLINLIVMGTD